MLSLLAPLEPARVAAKAEPYPCCRTTRFVIGGPSDLDEEMLGGSVEKVGVRLGSEGGGLAAA